MISYLTHSEATKNAGHASVSFVKQMEQQYGAKVLVYLAHETIKGSVRYSMWVKLIYSSPAMYSFDSGLRTTQAPDCPLEIVTLKSIRKV